MNSSFVRPGDAMIATWPCKRVTRSGRNYVSLARSALATANWSEVYANPCVPREGEISPFWRVISFRRSMRINHRSQTGLIIPRGGWEDLLWWKWTVQGRCFIQREEEGEEAGYNLIPPSNAIRPRFLLDIISAWTNRYTLASWALSNLYINVEWILFFLNQ